MKKSVGGIKVYQMALIGALGIIGILIGSFFDLSIAKTFYWPSNFYGKIFEAVGSLPGYALLGGSGVLLYLYFKTKKTDLFQGLAYACAFLLPLGFGAVYGYDVLKDFISSSTVAIGLGAVVVAIVDYGLFFYTRNSSPEEDLKIGLVTLFSGIIVIGLVFALKKAIARPRYLFVTTNGDDYFVNWWADGSAIKEAFLSQGTSLFQSFPSGHAALASFFLISPLWAKLNKKTVHKENLFFIAAFVWLLLVCFARISDGHHYLSDVSWGVLIGGFFPFLAGTLAYLPDTSLSQRAKKNKSNDVKSSYSQSSWRISKRLNQEKAQFISSRFALMNRREKGTAKHKESLSETKNKTSDDDKETHFSSNERDK